MFHVQQNNLHNFVIWHYRNPRATWKVGVNLSFWETAPYPSPELTLTLTSHLGQNDGLGEGYVGSFPEA